jgi:hypothetical protein
MTKLSDSDIRSIMLAIRYNSTVRSIMHTYHISFPTYKKIEKHYQAINSPKPSVTKEFLRRQDNIITAHVNKQIDDLTYRENMDDLRQHYGTVHGKFEIDKVIAMHNQSSRKNPKGVPLPRIAAKRKKSKRTLTVRELKHLQQLKELKKQQKATKTPKRN